MDAVVAVGAEVGVVLVVPELRHGAQAARRPPGVRVQHQPLGQHPATQAPPPVVSLVVLPLHRR